MSSSQIETAREIQACHKQPQRADGMESGNNIATLLETNNMVALTFCPAVGGQRIESICVQDLSLSLSIILYLKYSEMDRTRTEPPTTLLLLSVIEKFQI